MFKDGKSLCCCECKKTAMWIRHTQFAGNHPYCTEHAQKEEDFGKSDSSYFFWREVSTQEDIKPLSRPRIPGHVDRIRQLSVSVHRKDYDKVERFYEHTATELRKQAEGDREKGRHQLANLLEEAANIAEQQHKQFARIWALCKPYMRK